MKIAHYPIYDSHGREVGRYTIHRDGRPLREGGDGVVWWCEGPSKGQVHGDQDRPCHQLSNPEDPHEPGIFDAGKTGQLAARFQLTAVGARSSCYCNGQIARTLPRVGKPLLTYTPPPVYPRAAPCWCGSGRKAKKCGFASTTEHWRHVEQAGWPLAGGTAREALEVGEKKRWMPQRGEGGRFIASSQARRAEIAAKEAKKKREQGILYRAIDAILRRVKRK